MASAGEMTEELNKKMNAQHTRERTATISIIMGYLIVLESALDGGGRMSPFPVGLKAANGDSGGLIAFADPCLLR